MTRLSWFVLGASLGGLTLAATVVAYAAAPPQTAAPATPPPGIPDRGKAVIELPPKTIIANSAPAKPSADGFVNPKVEPGKVKWHATFAEACAASAKSGKPVMLFQMMGKLDDQFCWTNARLARAVLFSQERVADYINNTFEPVWESVRPVPIVRIDFGDGNVLTRTLHGNILTSVCTADGQVLDALPGIYEEQTYLDQLNQLRLLAKGAAKQPVQERAAWVKAYHQRQAEAIKKDQPPDQFVEKRKVAPPTKRLIEQPVEIVLQPAPKAEPQQQAQAPAPPKAAAAVVKEDAALWKALLEDTQLNESTRRRQIHELLADKGLVKPAAVTKPIYKDVLHADLDDPYLGLGKTLFATYPFAAEDGKR